MGDPYTNFLRGYYSHFPPSNAPPVTSFPSSYASSYLHHPPPPPSPPIREALPPPQQPHAVVVVSNQPPPPPRRRRRPGSQGLLQARHLVQRRPRGGRSGRRRGGHGGLAHRPAQPQPLRFGGGRWRQPGASCSGREEPAAAARRRRRRRRRGGGRGGGRRHGGGLRVHRDREADERAVLDPHPVADPHWAHPVLLPRLLQDLQPIQQHADAHVGPRVAVPQGPGVAAGHAADGDAAAAVLLLRGGVPEQHRPPAGAAAQGLPHAADALPPEARHQALHVPQVRQGLRRARRLAHPREELRQALVLRLRLRLQAQALPQGPHPRLRQGTRRLRHRLLRRPRRRRPRPVLRGRPRRGGGRQQYHYYYIVRRRRQCSSSTSSPPQRVEAAAAAATVVVEQRLRRPTAIDQPPG